MPEGGHDGGDGEGVGDLVDCPKEGTNFCQALWGWERDRMEFLNSAVGLMPVYVTRNPRKFTDLSPN